MRRTLSRPLVFAGWTLFGVGLFCPGLRDAGTTLPGWKCFVATLCCFPLWIAWPVTVFGITNLLYLFGLLAFIWGGGLERRAYGVFLLLAAGVTLAVTVAVIEGLRLGAYLWLASLFVTAAGFLMAEETPAGHAQGA